MTDTADARRDRRGLWIALVLAGILALAALVLFLSNNGREGSAQAGPPAGPAELQAAERASAEAEADTRATLQGAGRNLAEGAEQAVQAAGDAIERSTDGDPDSDNNEGR